MYNDSLRSSRKVAPHEPFNRLSIKYKDKVIYRDKISG